MKKLRALSFYQLLILNTFCFLVQKDPMQIEQDMADLWFSLSESEKDATEHETKVGVEISQCKSSYKESALSFFIFCFRAEI